MTPADPSVAEARRQLQAWTDCFLDAASSPMQLRQAGHLWFDWAMQVLGIDAQAYVGTLGKFGTDTLLPTGKAISPLGAARCVWEHQRTAVFLRAMDEALQRAFIRFPGETIHILEAGCGPLAPLALPFALRYPPGRVCLTLLDLHPESLGCARKIVGALGIEDSVRGYLAADATQVQFAPEDRPHVIVCEVLLRALKREPQLAATRNLAPQVRTGGFFLPECIDVDAVLFNSGEYHRERPLPFDLAAVRTLAITELGSVFRLDPATQDRLEPRGPDRFAAATILVPPHSRLRSPLHLMTRIRVFGSHVLGDFDSSLNLPEKVNYPDELATAGGMARFEYVVSKDPGLHLVAEAKHAASSTAL